MHKQKLTGILVLVVLIVPIILASMPVSALYRDTDPLASNWSNPPTGISAEWMTDKAMYTNKGGYPMFAIFWQNTQTSAQTVTLRARIVGYNSSWTTGYGIDCTSSLDPSDHFKLVTANYGIGSYGVYTDYYQQSAVANQDDAGTGQAFVIAVRVPVNATESSLTIQCNITNGASVTRYENATLHINPTNITYTIKLGSTVFEDVIDPGETLTHQFSVVNYATKTVDVALDYTLAIEDSDGDAVSTTGWIVKFYNYYGQLINIQRNVGASGTANPSFTLTAPSDEDSCPSGATITLTLTGTVCNDTRYQSSKVLGGTNATRTSSDFTAEDEEEAESWYDWILNPNDWLDYTYWAIAIIVVIVLGYLAVRGTGGRTRKRSK